MLATIFKYLFLIVFITHFQSVSASNTVSLNLKDGTEISVQIFEAQGDSLLLVLPSEHGITKGLTSIAGQLSAKGIETWIADPFTTWFLPEAKSSLSKIPLSAYKELIAEAIKTKKNVYLLSNDNGAGILLESARAWQLESKNVLSGVILISPNLYTKTPVAGEDGSFLPIARATNLPIFVFIPSKSVLALRINNTINALEEGGSDVYIQVLKNVRNRFFFRPDATDLEQQMTSTLSDKIIQSMKLTKTHDEIRKTVALSKVDDSTKKITTGSLRKQTGNFSPEDFTVNDINGSSHSLSQYKGQVVLVNFWASWCPPCVHEMPSMSELNQTLSDKPFTILAINLGEETEQIQKFLNEHPVNFPVLLDPNQELPKRWKVFAYPTSYILDKTGVIRYSVAGGIDWNAKEVKQVISELLNE